jgi:hypothetical protein
MSRRLSSALGEPTPQAVLALALAVAAALLLWESRGQTFFTDEWAFFADYRGLRPGVVLRPDAGNLVAIPVLIYKALIAVFGGDRYLPFRILWVFLDLLCATLFWQLARRRIGDWAALAPAILLLFFGAAWEVLGGPLGITILLTGSSGLGMLICLERRDLAGDVGACLLLTVALASYSFGVALAAGAAVEILFLRGREGRRRAWVFLLPLLLYGAWRVWAIQFHETNVTLENLLTLPSSIAASLAATIASITGTFRPPGVDGIATGPSFDSQTGWVLAVVLLGLVAVRLLRRGSRPIDPRAWVLVTIVLVYWASLGANLGPGRAPESSRYQYLAAVFLLLLGAELVAGARVSRRAGVGIAAGLALCLLGNLGNLHATGNFLRANSDQNRAELAAVDLVRGEVRPSLRIEPLGTTFPP